MRSRMSCHLVLSSQLTTYSIYFVTTVSMDSQLSMRSESEHGVENDLGVRFYNVGPKLIYSLVAQVVIEAMWNPPIRCITVTEHTHCTTSSDCKYDGGVCWNMKECGYSICLCDDNYIPVNTNECRPSK